LGRKVERERFRFFEPLQLLAQGALKAEKKNLPPCAFGGTPLPAGMGIKFSLGHRGHLR
jgi:hypothetical protein